MHRIVYCLALVLALGAAPEGSAQDVVSEFTERSGTLRLGDNTLTTGEFSDTYTLRVRAGEWVEVAMTSTEIDAYLILRPPNCEAETCANQTDNDDFLIGGGAYLWHQVDETGTWEILATSYQPGEQGAYDVRYRVVPDGDVPAIRGARLDERARRERLEMGDKTLNSGEFVDYYGFVGYRGEVVEIDLNSSAFDPYLILFMPEPHDQIDNDDHEGSTTHSHITATLPTDGLYRIAVTSYQPGESGSYTLEVAQGEQEDPFVKQ